MFLFVYLSALLVGVRVALCSDQKCTELAPLVGDLESGHSLGCYDDLINRVQQTKKLIASDYDLLQSTTPAQMNSMPVGLKADLFLAVYRSKKLLAEKVARIAEQIQEAASAGEKRVRPDAQLLNMQRQRTILHRFLKGLIMSGLNDFRAHALLWEAVCGALGVGRAQLSHEIKHEFQIPDNALQLREFGRCNRNAVRQRTRRKVIHVAVAIAFGILMEIATQASAISKNVSVGIVFCIIMSLSLMYLYKFGPGTAGDFAPGLGYTRPQLCSAENEHEPREQFGILKVMAGS